MLIYDDYYGDYYDDYYGDYYDDYYDDYYGDYYGDYYVDLWSQADNQIIIIIHTDYSTVINYSIMLAHWTKYSTLSKTFAFIEMICSKRLITSTILNQGMNYASLLNEFLG